MNEKLPLHILHTLGFVFVCVLIWLCVYPLCSWQCETPCASSQVCVHTWISMSTCVCVWVWVGNRQAGLSYGLHAVTEESRLWDVPGCQEHPPPTLYTLTAFHSSVRLLLQSTVSSASPRHLEIGPSASSPAWYEIKQLLVPYFLSWLTIFGRFFLSEWEHDRLAWSRASTGLTKIKDELFFFLFVFS